MEDAEQVIDITPEGIEQALDPEIVKRISELGFRADMISKMDGEYIVEGDIVVPASYLEGGQTRQARSSELIGCERVGFITIRVDNSIPNSGNDNWRDELLQAIDDWNEVQSALRLELVEDDNADITVRADGGVLANNVIADALFPSDGRPGNRIRINLDFNGNTNVSTGSKRYNMVHEIGHCIGFRHTNWSSRNENVATQISGTPSTDPNSVMNGGTALNTWAGFSTGDLNGTRILYPTRCVDGVGHVGEGAGVAIANIGGTSRPDIVLMGYDAPNSSNTFRYRVGYDLNASGNPTSWSSIRTVSGVGHIGEGASIAIGNIGGDSRPDLVLMAYDAPDGANTFRYKIGYDLSSSGNARSWTSTKTISGVGHIGEGAGVAIANIDGNSRPELILMAYDAPNGANTFRYKIGYNLSTSGNASSWSSIKTISGVGNVGHGAGVVVGNVGGNLTRPDIILMAYDAPNGPNSFHHKIGYDLNASGNVGSWSGTRTIEGVGHFGDGADLAILNVGTGVGNDTKPELFLMTYDAPSGANQFRYRVGFNLNLSGTAQHW